MPGPDWSRRAILQDYATLLELGLSSPAWSSPGQPPAFDPEEQAWIGFLEAEAEKDGIRIAPNWEQRFDGFHLVCAITSPRHDRSYGIPRRRSDPLWRQRFERDWGQRLKLARARVAGALAELPDGEG